MEFQGGLAGEGFLCEQTARVRQRNQNQGPREEVEGARNNPRHKLEAVEQSTDSEVFPHLATLSRRPETPTTMVLQANIEVLSKGDEETRRQDFRDVSSRNLQECVSYLLFPPLVWHESGQSGTQSEARKVERTHCASLPGFQ